MFYSISKNKYLFWLVTVAYTKLKAIYDATIGGGAVAAASDAAYDAVAAYVRLLTLNFNCEYNIYMPRQPLLLWFIEVNAFSFLRFTIVIVVIIIFGQQVFVVHTHSAHLIHEVEIETQI